MTNPVLAREAPAAPSLDRGPDSTHPHVPKEPVLAIHNIQGDIIGGFRKDHETLLFLEIRDAADFRRWLAEVTPFVATAEEVIAFNRLFKAVRSRRKVETQTVQATWLNIAFSYAALKKLGADLSPDFGDEAFRAGMAARSAELKDPQDPDAEGHQKNWVIGGHGNEADVVLIVASDNPGDLLAEVERLETTIYATRSVQGEAIHSGARILYKQHGATLPQPLTGHEHFGFLDGVSQPGIRGRLSDADGDVLTPRQNPDNPDQGKPGQDLLWPGEFVFGYPGQDPTASTITTPGPVVDAGPPWAKDGSFLCFRRLRQDVPGFHKFLRDTAEKLDMSPDLLGAKLVGRWDSGAPIMRAPKRDNNRLANDDCANNHFEFAGEDDEDSANASRPAQPRPDDGFCRDTFPPAKPDPDGVTCPFGAHIRKAYPRDDEFKTGQGLNEVTTQTHRLLRRGIPFGAPFSESLLRAGDTGQPDSGDRGLLFLAYQTSLVRQFEFVIKNWVNNPGFKEPGSGHDPILGQASGPNGDRTREFSLTISGKGDGRTETITLPADWVIPTGGGYFFAPSIEAMKALATGERARTPSQPGPPKKRR